jgi:hypothetical protein
MRWRVLQGWRPSDLGWTRRRLRMRESMGEWRSAFMNDLRDSNWLCIDPICSRLPPATSANTAKKTQSSPASTRTSTSCTHRTLPPTLPHSPTQLTHHPSQQNNSRPLTLPRPAHLGAQHWKTDRGQSPSGPVPARPGRKAAGASFGWACQGWVSRGGCE